MKARLRTILLFVAAMTLVVPRSLAEENVSYIALLSEPIAFVEKGNNRGIYIDILNELATRVNLNQMNETTIAPFARILKRIKKTSMVIQSPYFYRVQSCPRQLFSLPPLFDLKMPLSA